nr:MAG TPA: hypothetical protein [Caudoviricetes sp.]
MLAHRTGRGICIKYTLHSNCILSYPDEKINRSDKIK